MNTFTHKTALAAIAASLVAALPVPALAQESSSNVGAVAELYVEEGPPPPPPLRLRVAGTRRLTFGRLQVPSGIRPDNRCVYEVSLGNSGASGDIVTLANYREIEADGSVVGANDPEATDCGWSARDLGDGSAETGRFEVTCSLGNEVNYQLRMATGATPGVFFAAPSSGKAVFTRKINPITTIVSSPIDDFAFRLTCTETDDVFGPTPGVLGGGSFFVGGQLTVTENAAASDGLVDVGTITLEASY